jgi:hypothetical protein
MVLSGLVGRLDLSAVGHVHNERLRRVDDVPLHPAGDPAHGRVGERAVNADRPRLLLRQEDRRARNRPIDAVCRSPEGLEE